MGRRSRTPLDGARLLGALHTTVTRGPDSQSVLRFADTGWQLSLGFCRLTVRDRSFAAGQPMTRGEWTVLFNGEIYNADRLRSELIRQQGAQFLTTGDSEVVVSLLQYRGAAAIAAMEGMFAVAAYNHRDKTLVLARDPFGIKPLYWQHDGDGVTFGSTVDAVRRLSGTTTVDTAFFARMVCLDHFIGYDGRTPFRAIAAVPPGSIIEVDGDDRVRSTRFWSTQGRAGERAVADPDEIAELVETSVRAHLVADVRLSGALSGGVDSSLIARVATTQRQDIDFFTIDVGDEGGLFHDDARYSRLVFDQLGLSSDRYHLVPPREPWSLQVIDEFVRVLGTPVYDERALVWHSLYGAARDAGTTVFLNGQGADELWYGYYPRLWEWFTVLYHEPATVDVYVEHFGSRLRASAIGDVLNPDLSRQWRPLAAEVFDRVQAASASPDPRHRLSSFLISDPLVNLLTMEDAFSMLHSIEVRVPFLTRPLADLALSLSPDAQLGSTRQGKDALKLAAARWLPPEVVRRPKSPLPKPPPGDDDLTRLFRRHLDEIRSDELVRAVYDVSRLDRLMHSSTGTFYGGITEAMLQVLSTWRFHETVAR